MPTVKQYQTDPLAKNRELLNNPSVQAMLKTIRYAEGTSGDRGYNTRVGYSQFDDLSKKPGKKVYIPAIKEYSSAEGAYQFLNSTWNGVSKKLGLKDFSPESQDLAAIELIKNRGALTDVLNNNLTGALSKLSKEWASLPTAEGKSAYSNQKSKKVESLAKVFYGQNQNYENSVAPYMYTPPPFTTIQIPEMQTQQVSYLDTPQETTNLAEETEAKPSKINPQEEAFMQDLLSQMAEGVGYVEPEKSAVFQVGGTKKPIYVSDKNDPKYTAYQDSLKLYNKYDIKNKQFENITNKNNIKTAKTYADDFLELENNKIAPIGTNTMMARYGTDNIINKQDKEFSKKDSQILRDAQDRLAGEYSIRGRIPIYKKPTQPIQVLQKAEIPTINLIQSNLQHQGIIEPDFELEASTDIRVPYRTPKYYDIQDNSNPNAGFGDGYGGNQSNYRSFDPSKLPPADNRTITPRYQEGGQIPISPEGMYAYPNQPVIIPSSRITMKNIPHSILAVTDQGDRQILQPEKEYQLKGNNTLEIPLTKAEENFLKDLYETHKK